MSNDSVFSMFEMKLHQMIYIPLSKDYQNLEPLKQMKKKKMIKPFNHFIHQLNYFLNKHESAWPYVIAYIVTKKVEETMHGSSLLH